MLEASWTQVKQVQNRVDIEVISHEGDGAGRFHHVTQNGKQFETSDN